VPSRNQSADYSPTHFEQVYVHECISSEVYDALSARCGDVVDKADEENSSYFSLI